MKNRHNKRMQSDQNARYAFILSADAKRYVAILDEGVKLMVRVLASTILVFLLASQHAVAADVLCPKNAPLQEGVDDLRMQEDEFTAEQAMDAVKFLQTDFSKRIFGTNAVKDFHAWSGHYISYANSLKFIEGALLKQQVLINRARLKELSVLVPESAEISQLKVNLEAATQKFCVLLSTAEYVD